MTAFFPRVQFILKYRTLKRIVVEPSDSQSILVYHKGYVKKLKRRCPHQGAPLETGYFQEDALVCPWHGCHFPLSAEK